MLVGAVQKQTRITRGEVISVTSVISSTALLQAVLAPAFYCAAFARVPISEMTPGSGTKRLPWQVKVTNKCALCIEQMQQNRLQTKAVHESLTPTWYIPTIACLHWCRVRAAAVVCGCRSSTLKAGLNSTASAVLTTTASRVRDPHQNRLKLIDMTKCSAIRGAVLRQ